jgi:hypothetical protein
MLVKNVIRGNKVTFKSVFYDDNNIQIDPVAPTLTVYYRSNNAYLTVTANMTFSNTENKWVGTWDSSNADVGIVQWHIAGGTGTSVAEDGDFRIISNKANGGAGAS